MATPSVKSIVAAELAQAVGPAAAELARSIRQRHAKGAVAVLFYGSCLRQPDRDLADALLDFYLLVDDYRAAYDQAWLAVANRLLPPNVFYCEADWQGGRLRAKYVVI